MYCLHCSKGKEGEGERERDRTTKKEEKRRKIHSPVRGVCVCVSVAHRCRALADYNLSWARKCKRIAIIFFSRIIFVLLLEPDFEGVDTPHALCLLQLTGDLLRRNG